MACLQEDCANWDGDGCPCRVLDIKPVDVREDDDGPECDLCGSTKCPDADLPGFSEPRDCVLAPVYEVLRYDRCDYGCGRDITTATVRRAAQKLRELVQSPGPGVDQ